MPTVCCLQSSCLTTRYTRGRICNDIMCVWSVIYNIKYSMDFFYNVKIHLLSPFCFLSLLHLFNLLWSILFSNVMSVLFKIEYLKLSDYSVRICNTLTPQIKGAAWATFRMYVAQLAKLIAKCSPGYIWAMLI